LKSVFGEFSSGVSACPSKGPQSDCGSMGKTLPADVLISPNHAWFGIRWDKVCVKSGQVHKDRIWLFEIRSNQGFKKGRSANLCYELVKASLRTKFFPDILLFKESIDAVSE